MWKTVYYSCTNKPLIDINDQGVVYSYRTKSLKKLKKLKRGVCFYLYWTRDNHNYYVHQEVAKAFPEICGEWFEGCEVHHKDGNSQNNEATNLIVCTKEQHWEYHRILKNNKVITEIQKKKKCHATKENKKDIFSKSEFTRYYCRKSKISKKTGKAPIEVSVTYNKTRHLFNTGFFENPSLFTGKVKSDFEKFFKDYFTTL